MTDFTVYLNARRHLRARAEYSGRDSLYLQGRMSLNEALKALGTFGEVTLMQQYVRGKKVEIWKRGRWKTGTLEKLSNPNYMGDFK